jgi:hypothetical protein
MGVTSMLTGSAYPSAFHQFQFLELRLIATLKTLATPQIQQKWQQPLGLGDAL